MPPIVPEILGFLGFLVRALGFLLFGYAAAKFAIDSYNKASWQVQVALVIGLFGMTVGLTEFSTPGSAGCFALGAGVALLMAGMPKKKDDTDSKGK